MYEILEDTQSRLALRIGTRGGWNWTVFRLDRATGQMTLERGLIYVRRRTLTIPLSDIVRIDAISTNNQLSTLVGLRSGKRRWCAADSDVNTADAVERLRSFLQLQPIAGTPLSPVFRWTTRIVSGLAIGVAVLIGISKISEMFFLPGCDAQRTRDTLNKLLTAPTNGGAAPALSEFKTVADEKDEKQCRAVMRSADGAPRRLSYRVFWKDSNVMVQYLGNEPITSDAAR